MLSDTQAQSYRSKGQFFARCIFEIENGSIRSLAGFSVYVSTGAFEMAMAQ